MRRQTESLNGNQAASLIRRQIAILVSGSGVSRIGDFVYLVALNLYVLDATHSAFAVAAVWIVPLVARTLAGSWAGSLTDRLPLRKMLVGLEITRACIVFTLPLVPIIWIYPLLFLLGTASTFFGRAFLPYRTRLIPLERRKSVNSLMSLTQSSALLLGPAIAGAFMAFGPVTFAFWIDAGSFAISGLSFLVLPEFLQDKTNREDARKASIGIRTWTTLRHDWQEGARFLSANWLFTALFITTAIGNVFGQAADSQEVVYAEEALHLGRFGYGMMVVAAGVGFLSGAIVLSALSKYFSTRWLIASGGIMAGVGYLIYALAGGFWQAVVGLIVLGVFGSAAGVGYSTYAQNALPIERMGRINNLLEPPQQGATLVMMVLASVVTEHYGVRVLMIGMTCIMIGAGIINTVIVLQRRHRDAIESDTIAI